MESDGDARAYVALSEHPRLADLAAIAQDAMRRAAEDRRSEAQPEPTEKLAAERSLTREEAATPFGNALDVLARGPTNSTERTLARALAGHVLELWPEASDDEDLRASHILWLATHTWFDATRFVDQALGDRADRVWDAFAKHIRRHDEGMLAALGRPEALVATIALASSRSANASRLAGLLATEARDPMIATLLRRASDRSAVHSLVGEWAHSPRGWFATASLGMTGVSLVMNVARAVLRVAFAYRKPAEVTLSEDGGVRVRWRIELLGRTLRDRDVVVPRSALARATRDVRYPRLALYAALFALALGSYIGFTAFVDGFRAGSPSVVAAGLAIVAAGFGLDLALSSIASGARGRCTVVFVPRRGTPLCVGSVDIAAADAVLTRLSRG
ncbi:MAG: hypothetical protein ABSF69_01985 [Polyangiaceae bacterium]|jgi:hypothetical protein